MLLHDMHIWFRQYAQQMGMQNVRAILPEQIDLLINTSINDVYNQLIREHIGLTNDRVITDNSKIGKVNAFKTLYRVEEILISPFSSLASHDIPATKYGSFVFSKRNKNTGKLVYNRRLYGSSFDSFSSMPDCMFITDFAISYKKADKGYGAETTSGTDAYPVFSQSSDETTFFPVRLIDDSYLADTLNDFILKPRLRSPIIIIYNDGVSDTGEKNTVFELYIDKFKKTADDRYILDYDLLPYKLRFSYLAKPAKVQYREDLSEDNTNIECDLPEYLHIDILKHAVDLYRIAISGALHATQQQERAAQQDSARNNYRNEGNAS